MKNPPFELEELDELDELGELEELDEFDEFEELAPPVARAVAPVTCETTRAVITPKAMIEPAINADFSRCVTSTACALGMRAGRGGAAGGVGAGT